MSEDVLKEYLHVSKLEIFPRIDGPVTGHGQAWAEPGSEICSVDLYCHDLLSASTQSWPPLIGNYIPFAMCPQSKVLHN